MYMARISCRILIHIHLCVICFIVAQSNVTDSVLEVVAYEARRLFRDRLVSSKDLHTFDNILSSIIRGDWGSDALDNMPGMTYSSSILADLRLRFRSHTHKTTVHGLRWIQPPNIWAKKENIRHRLST